jgi:hypothetical protein
MLLWISIAILTVGILWICFDWFYEGEIWGFALTLIGSFAVAIALIVFGVNQFGVDGRVERLQVRYESLVYQYENDVYDNDNDIGKRELITDIVEWNEMVASGRANQNNFWIGVFIPDIYDQFEFIELEK